MPKLPTKFVRALGTAEALAAAGVDPGFLRAPHFTMPAPPTAKQHLTKKKHSSAVAQLLQAQGYNVFSFSVQLQELAWFCTSHEPSAQRSRICSQENSLPSEDNLFLGTP